MLVGLSTRRLEIGIWVFGKGRKWMNDREGIGRSLRTFDPKVIEILEIKSLKDKSGNY